MKPTIRILTTITTILAVLFGVLPIEAGSMPVAHAATPAGCPSGYAALTFDDGPNPVYTKQVLDILGRYGVKGTFFVNGNKVAANASLIRRMQAEGHRVASHGWAHVSMNTLTDAQILASHNDTYAAIAATGAEPLRLYRPPYGATSARVRAAAAKGGWTEIKWNVDTRDWETNNATKIRNHIINDSKTVRQRGQTPVVLMHDRLTGTVNGLPGGIEGLAKAGFCFGVLDSKGNVVPPTQEKPKPGPDLCKPNAKNPCDTVILQDYGARMAILPTINSEEPSKRFFYGHSGDVFFTGDWDCDGIKTPGLYRQSTGFVYLRNSNTEGVADISFYFGRPGDVPIAGDFNGDGCDTVSVYRPSEARFYIINKLGKNGQGLGNAEYSFYFGNYGDVPFVGDFDGDGKDTVGLHRPSTGLVYYRNDLKGGWADHSFIYGRPGDHLLAGDWDGDGVDTVAVYRPSTGVIYYRNSNTAGVGDSSVWVGSYAGVGVTRR